MKSREVLSRAFMLTLGFVMVMTLARATCGKTPPPKSPMLISPANGAQLEEQRPVFSWQAVGDINDYEIEIADNELFQPVVIGQAVTGTSFVPAQDLGDGAYFWHVRAKQKDVWGEWQEFAWSFDVSTPPPPPRKLTLASIYFDFDRSDIRKGDAGVLEGNAATITDAADADFTPPIMVEGHCDPKGTAEYNMALGQRRADKAKAFLVKMGVDVDQLTAISYGEEKLVTTNPAEYEKDRRAEFHAQSK